MSNTIDGRGVGVGVDFRPRDGIPAEILGNHSPIQLDVTDAEPLGKARKPTLRRPQAYSNLPIRDLAVSFKLEKMSTHEAENVS